MSRPRALVLTGSLGMGHHVVTEVVADSFAAKAGLKAYMETMALELAPFGVRVNMLTPGHYPTRLTAGLAEDKAARLRREIPLRRFGSPAPCRVPDPAVWNPD